MHGERTSPAAGHPGSGSDADWYRRAEELAGQALRGEVDVDALVEGLDALSGAAPGWLSRLLAGELPVGLPAGRPGPSALEVLAAASVSSARTAVRRLRTALASIGGPDLPEPGAVAILGWIATVPPHPRWPAAARELEADLMTHDAEVLVAAPGGELAPSTLAALASSLEQDLISGAWVVSDVPLGAHLAKEIETANRTLAEAGRGRVVPVVLKGESHVREALPGVSRPVRKATGAAPPAPVAGPGEVEALFQEGVRLLALDEAEEALSLLQKAVKAAPEHSRAWYALGMATAEAMTKEVALECFREATKLDPTLSAAWLDRAEIEDEMGKAAEARLSYETFLALATRPEERESRQRVEARLAAMAAEAKARATAPPPRPVPPPPRPAAVDTATPPARASGSRPASPAPPPMMVDDDLMRRVIAEAEAEASGKPSPAGDTGGEAVFETDPLGGPDLPAASSPPGDGGPRSGPQGAGSKPLSPPSSRPRPSPATRPSPRPGPAASTHMEDGVETLDGYFDPTPIIRALVQRRLAVIGICVGLFVAFVPGVLDTLRNLLTDTDDYPTLMGLPPSDRVLGAVAQCLLTADAALARRPDADADKRVLSRVARDTLRRYGEGSVTAGELREYNALQAKLRAIGETGEPDQAAETALRLGIEFYARAHEAVPHWSVRFRVAGTFRKLLVKDRPFLLSPEEVLDVPSELRPSGGDPRFERIARKGKDYWSDPEYIALASSDLPLPPEASVPLASLVGQVDPSLVPTGGGSRPVEQLLPRLGDAVSMGALAAINALPDAASRRALAGHFARQALDWKESARVEFFRILLRAGWNASVPPLPEGVAWADALAREFANSPYGAPS